MSNDSNQYTDALFCFDGDYIVLVGMTDESIDHIEDVRVVEFSVEDTFDLYNPAHAEIIVIAERRRKRLASPAAG